jgi:hypothetical protein
VTLSELQKTYGSGLFGHHAQMLVDSKISPEVARQRGYVSHGNGDAAALRRMGFSKKQALVPGVLIPGYTVDGQRRLEYRPDNPRRDDDGKPRKYERIFGTGNFIDVHPSVRADLGDPGKALFITEGIKKGDALVTAGVVAVALTGVSCWRGKNDKGGVAELSDWDRIAINDRAIWIVFDSDALTNGNVGRMALRLGAMLERRGAKVGFAFPPEGPNGEKQGVDDFLARGRTIDELVAGAIDAKALRDKVDLRPLVWDTDPPLDLKERAVELLVDHNDPPGLFSRGGELVRIVKDEHGHAIRLESKPLFRDRLERCIRVLRATDGGFYEVPMPTHVLEDLLATAGHASDFPVLKVIVTSPCFAADGTLVVENGYSAEGQVFVDLGALVVPDLPSVAKAKAVLFDILQDFPFTDEASLAHAIALMVLPLVRLMIDGPTPLHMVDAPTAGTGKGLLVDVLLEAMSGGSIARFAPVTDDQEMRKRITAVLLAGRQFVLMDNLAGRIDSPSLAAALTAPVWEDRVLGHSRVVTIPNTPVWLAAANNPSLSAELARRCVHIRLDAGEERPWERTDFRYPDLRGRVACHRGEIVAAALALVKAWIDAGRPLAPVSFGDYRSWATTVGGILQVVGIPGFLANSAERFDDAAVEQEEIAQIVAMWWDVFGQKPVMARELFEQAQLWNIVPDLAPPKGERSMTTVFGTWLRSHRDQIVLSYRITDAGHNHTKVRLWKLVPVDRGDLGERHFAKVLVNDDAAGTAGTSPFPDFVENPADVPAVDTSVDTDVELLADLPAVPAASVLTCENALDHLSEVPAPINIPRAAPDEAGRAACHGCHLPFTAAMSEMESGKAVVASKLVVDYCVDCAMTTDLNGLVVVVAKEPAFT